MKRCLEGNSDTTDLSDAGNSDVSSGLNTEQMTLEVFHDRTATHVTRLLFCDVESEWKKLPHCLIAAFRRCLNKFFRLLGYYAA